MNLVKKIIKLYLESILKNFENNKNLSTKVSERYSIPSKMRKHFNSLDCMMHFYLK